MVFGEESSSLQELEQIPGVGKTIAQDMQNIGIHSIDALKGRQAEHYDRLCEFKASPVDRCMLYVFNWLYISIYLRATSRLAPAGHSSQRFHRR
ncbi:MAG: helix-hairpin-helix domain-containing protein [Planctomycetota bacterium]